MEWKLTSRAKENMEKLSNEEETEHSFGGGDGFWYDITDEGYFNVEEVLLDEEQIKKVNEAVELLKDLEDNVYSKINPEPGC